MPSTKLTKRRRTKGSKRGNHLRKQKRTKKVHFEEKKHKIPRVYIQNFGSSETFMDINNKKSDSKLKWMGDYDGETAKLQVDINNNNNRKVYKIEMDNKQLSRLLGAPSVDMPLDKRLKNDFLKQNPAEMDEETNELIKKFSNNANMEMPIKRDKGNVIPVFTNNNKNVMLLENGLQKDM
jgi:hypothetical protein